MIKFVRYVTIALLLSSVSLMANRLMRAGDEGERFNLPESSSGAKAGTMPNPVFKGRVHTAGLLWLNVTNFGLIGSMGTAWNFREHCSGKIALGAELPGASGMDYLYGGGLWFGGYLDSASSPSTGIAFKGPMCTSGYEGWGGQNLATPAHPAMELWPTGYSAINGITTSDAKKAQIVEMSNIKGQVNCFYTPVYDSVSAKAHEQFTTWYTDKFTDNKFTDADDFDDEAYGRRVHLPMGVDVKQVSYAWSSKFAQKFVIVDYTLYNTNDEHKDIYNFFVGMFLDNDIGKSSYAGKGLDDLGGFKQKAKILDQNTGEYVSVPINMAWVADNDGRDPSCGSGNDITAIADCEGDPGDVLDGATSIFSLRVLRNPNPKVKYSFNSYNSGQSSSALVENGQDWGPSWKTGYHMMDKIADPETGDLVKNLGNWDAYDLTFNQKGYSDGGPNDKWGHMIGQGGLTEGRPLGDYGRYMVMSNGERDYDVDRLLNDGMAAANENYLIPTSVKIEPASTEPLYKQRHKFKPYTPADGIESMRKELGNGADDKFIVSFGPLGYETKTDVATSSGKVNKTVWKFAYGDSIKLTLAYIVSENFHYWLGQDPRNPDLDDETQKVNWGDAFRNALWADRLYDVPMYDTEVTKNGITKKDGWFGEDVGKDATFALAKGNPCWWNNQVYQGPDAVGAGELETSEGNMKLDHFTAPFVPAVADGNPTTADWEDNFLWKGNTWFSTAGANVPAEDDTIGTTAEYGALYQQIVNIAAVNAGAQPVYDNVRIGWNDSLLTHGDGVPDFSAPEPPVSPKIKVETEGSDVIVTWTTDQFGNLSSSPEKETDKFSRKVDFEGYQIWLSDTRNINDFVEVFSVDRKNYAYENQSIPGKYLDVPFMDVADSRIAPNVIAAGDTVPRYLVDVQGADSTWSAPLPNNSPYTYVKSEFGNNKLLTADHTSPNLVMYSSKYLREVNNTKIYEYKAVLKNKLLGKKQYVAVTSSDYGDPKSEVEQLKSSPMVNAVSFVPGKISGSNKVYVVPNPYRADIDYEALGWERVADKWREVDRKIEFINVPKHSIVRIYTLAGDLVKTLSHNGDANESSREGDYVAKWNLLNQNDQAVASGIYLFAVEDLDGGKEKFVGKFVIIK